MRSITNELAVKMNEARWGKFETRYDWNLIQDEYDKCISLSEVVKKFGLCRSTISKAIEKGLIIPRKFKKPPMSLETKTKISDKRKAWLMENPDKHPWRNKDKFQSKPCEKIKEFLKSLDVEFISEYYPEIENRYFSIDIAMPDKMIALEINGNQHYERTGELKPYYQERHDLLESCGWNVYEIHYSACFNLEKWGEFVTKLKDSEKKMEFDYFNYVPREKKKYVCCDCGKDVGYKKITRCRSCRNKYRNTNSTSPENWKCCDCGILVGHHKTIRCKFCYNIHRKLNSSPTQIRTENVSVETRSDNPFHHEAKNIYCECGNIKNSYAKKCMECYNFNRRIVKNRPSKEELEKLIWEYPLTTLGKMYGVSDNSIRKWCKGEGIEKFPNNKYWRNK